jgi:hypothetical protein
MFSFNTKLTEGVTYNRFSGKKVLTIQIFDNIARTVFILFGNKSENVNHGFAVTSSLLKNNPQS